MLRTKQEIRKYFLETRLKINENDYNVFSQLAALNVYSNFYLISKSVGLYFPIKKEINPLFMCDFGIHSTSLPVITDEGMIFKKWHNGEKCVAGKFGVMEPDTGSDTVIPDVLIVPIVAFDKGKNRIGYGKGYYDRYLQTFEGIKIGMAFEAQLTDYIPVEKFDVPLDYIVTETNFY